MGGWQEGESEPGLCRSAPSVPPALPLTLGLCPFSHPCSEEAKSTTWLHPVTGEAVVTGHRRHSTGNAEPGRARAELGSVGRRRQNPGRQPSGNLPRTAVPGRRRGGRRSARVAAGIKNTGCPPPEFSRVSGPFSCLQPFITTWRRRPLPASAPPSQPGHPPCAWGGRIPSPRKSGILSFSSCNHSRILLLPLLQASSSFAPTSFQPLGVLSYSPPCSPGPCQWSARIRYSRPLPPPRRAAPCCAASSSS